MGSRFPHWLPVRVLGANQVGEDRHWLAPATHQRDAAKAMRRNKDANRKPLNIRHKLPHLLLSRLRGLSSISWPATKTPTNNFHHNNPSTSSTQQKTPRESYHPFGYKFFPSVTNINQNSHISTASQSAFNQNSQHNSVSQSQMNSYSQMNYLPNTQVTSNAS